MGRVLASVGVTPARVGVASVRGPEYLQLHEAVVATPSYLTLQEAADRLKCSTKTVRRYVAQGRLTGYRVGPTMLRVRADELDALVSSGAIPNARTA